MTMKHNIIYCNTKSQGFITMTFKNPDLFFANIPAQNDNNKPFNARKRFISDLQKMANNVPDFYKNHLRRVILGKCEEEK